MVSLDRNPENPLVRPDSTKEWKSLAAFNPSVVKDGGIYHMAYRAMSHPKDHAGAHFPLSIIGYAKSTNGVNFSEDRPLIVPSEPWDTYGCEDPRITKIDGKFYIFYTALGGFPFSADNIKCAVAITTDFEKFEKHLVTPFNAKAMTLLADRLDGKLAAILSANTDRPPAKIALALFDKESDIWSKEYWDDWYAHLDDHVIPLLRSPKDQVEVGGAPIKTPHGWLFVHSYIKNYRTGWAAQFGIEAALLSSSDPRAVIGRTNSPLLIPDTEYERHGIVQNIAFPSSAIIDGEELVVYYGGADTTCNRAFVSLEALLLEVGESLLPGEPNPLDRGKFIRSPKNPILRPRPEFLWEAKAVFNPAALDIDGKIHIIYRAMSEDNTSVMGYASSRDGYHIDERLNHPIYVPREPFEEKRNPGGNSGCEDPRLTKIDDTYHLYYTAYNGQEPPRVALSSIKVEDFLKKEWRWTKPVIISPPGQDDKDACLLEKKINGKFVVFHRLGHDVWIDFLDDVKPPAGKWLSGRPVFGPRVNEWDSLKVGIAAPPIETARGWLVLYHGVSATSNIYRTGAILLDLNDPFKIIARTSQPIFEPEMPYEQEGQVQNVVFPCGAVVRDGTLTIYYGGADTVVGVASVAIDELIDSFIDQH